jgi:foldase protein PrsA
MRVEGDFGMKRLLINGCILVLLLLAAAGCARRNENADFAVARVNGADIMASEARFHLPFVEERLEWEFFIMYQEWEIDFDREFEPGKTFRRALSEGAVREAVFHNVTLEYARQLGVVLTVFDQIMVEDNIERLVAHYGREEFDRLVLESGFRDEAHMTEFLESQLIFENLITLILDNPDDFAHFWVYMPPEETVPDLLGAKHILARFANFENEQAAEDYANELLARLAAGEDFDTLMYDHTQDPGILDFPVGYSFAAGEMVPEFEQMTRDLAMGEVSGLVRTSHGFHIIKRIEPNPSDWLAMQPLARSEQQRMLDAIFTVLSLMADEAEIEFLPALDDL